jgi:two-component system, cell cycle sensor histidine kinase and response regulator CckA
MENIATILVVDDDEGMRQTLELILKRENYQVITAEVGDAALVLAQTQSFNVALLDIRLPDMTGTNLLAQLKQLQPEMEVMLITGYATLESAMQAVIAGAYHYFIKPLNMDEVLGKIKEILAKQHLVSENRRLYQSALHELAERQRVEEDLRQRNRELALLNAVIEQSAESVLITDTKGVISYVNPMFEHETGYSRAEVIGQNPRILKSSRHDLDFYHELWTTIKAGGVWHGRLINKRKDGSIYTSEAIISPVRDEQGSIVNYVSLRRDITHDLELEEQYRRAQRMEAVGQLTGGIAHDFNNLLTAINGFAELIKYRLSPHDPLRELADNILRSGQRAADLVSQLLAFSRKQIIEPKVLNLNSLVVEMGLMLRRTIGENIELDLILRPDLWPVKVDRAQFEQIIVNLSVNARDAMPDGGHLTIETSNVTLDADYVATHLGSQPGDYVLVTVSDTGTGMDKQTQARIFEPFFTTKEVGKGTGLGLATVFGIVKQSGGNIWVYSEEGHGSAFKIYLPRVEAEAQPTPKATADLPLPNGTETILLVEDDNGVRDLAQRILQKQGYRILAAPNGPEALQLAAHHRGPIHLLVADVVMPGLNGKALADQLTALYPSLKVLFMSGYTENAIAHHHVLDPGVVLLPKPFNARALAQQVRAVLDAPHP